MTGVLLTGRASTWRPWGDGTGTLGTTNLITTVTFVGGFPMGSVVNRTCGPASPGLQFGSWGTVITITMQIDCPVPTEQTTWGRVKELYR